MGSLSIWHWLIVLVIVALVFGTKKLRNMGSDLGGAVRGFKDGMREGEIPPGGVPGETSRSGMPPATGTTGESLPRAKDTVDVETRDRSNLR